MTQAQKDLNVIERLRDEEKSPFVEQLLKQAIEIFATVHPEEITKIKMLENELPRMD